ncbi:NAD-dependent epimerase/dehydratase family protein [Mesobacillus subterraneus]|uniref:NAD-dependent epimerase/dehydratase family protein n=1 Tax=Mesobacillus subterraneus TaxID=285983 RepID=A0A3R9E772_9BACI|nr:NAD-dependent epimerase/dehydratase family protein [Mesobacillus subterraneus]RSD27651.1 NAD-dependent epimerase/dehydratase family protein [Mesobacillus subterraneus]
MRILITGGAGFIGSHLAVKMLKEQHELAILDNLHPYYSVERKKQHLEVIKLAGDFEFYQSDLLDREETIRIIEKFSPEAIVHLAALPGVAYSILRPLEYIDYDVKATVNVLEGAGKAGVRQVVFASSSSVYGMQNQEIPFKEDMATGKPISPYAASKYAAESFCHVYGHLYGLDMKILRFFTVYGPWGRPDMAIVNFIKKLKQGEEITVFGQGGSRDYTYVSDIVAGIERAIEKLQHSAILNIGSGRPISMEQLLAELKLYYPDMVIRRDGERAGDVDRTWADISAARELLGYEPKMDFSKGIAETVAWAEQYEKFL